MAIAGISIQYERSKAVDFTVPYHTDHQAVAVKLTSNKWLYFIKPLSTTMYILVVVTTILLTIVTWSLGISSRNKGHDCLTIYEIWFMFIKLMLNQGIKKQFKKNNRETI